MNHEHLFSWEKLFRDIRQQRQRSLRWTIVETAQFSSRALLVSAHNLLDAGIAVADFSNWATPRLAKATNSLVVAPAYRLLAS